MSKELDALRHSGAHLLAAAVMELYPKAKPTIGPSIENGFYYDFDDLKISVDDLPKIEKKMRHLVESWVDFKGEKVATEKAKGHFGKNKYKLELIDELDKEKAQISLYTSGGFTDLCRGGHVDNPSRALVHFKLLSVAGAYWRGSEKNKMLTRIYGTAWKTEKDLMEHLENLEEAKKRDHRKLGKELDLFTISDKVGPGLVLWLPKGNIIKEELENWAKETEEKAGYKRVSTPHITKEGLYYTSGHLPYYKDDMYPVMQLDGETNYYLKPMNCPHHHTLYAARPKSYRDLPLRFAEYGMCYRYEGSGELFGLMRVRGLDMNDSHIYCTEEQAVEEFIDVMKLHEHYYKTLGIEHYHLEMALRDPENKEKYHGDEKMWAKAESLMRKAVEKVDIKMVEEQGSAAFYGPKIDFIIHSSIGKEYAISTNQIDLYMGGKFELKYVDKDGIDKTPVIIHRAPLGSHERFIGFLIEHFGGAFPVWLSPVQVKILPITDKQMGYAEEVAGTLRDEGIRVEVDERSETLGAKIRDGQMEKVPYMLILGGQEEEGKNVTVRMRSGEERKNIELDGFKELIVKKIESKALNLI